MGELEQEILCIEQAINCAELFSIMNTLRKGYNDDPDVTPKVRSRQELPGRVWNNFKVMSICRFCRVVNIVVLNFDI